VRAAGEPGHVDADLGEDDFSAATIDAVDRVQQVEFGMVRLDLDCDAAVKLVDHRAERVDMLADHSCQERVVIGEAADQRFGESGDLGAHSAKGEFGKHLPVALSGDQRVQDGAA
jgi:hypothetical protein